jgi:XTP/dITP diphosphohydrolase
MPSLLLATRNLNKTTEVRAILGADWEVTDLTAHPEWPEVEETGATFADNAALKALAASARAGDAWVLADDSGLEVDALRGAPGVQSARYSGPDATDARNRAKLTADLEKLGPAAPRLARFHCVIALARAGRLEGSFDGVVEGSIIARERGLGGFGYDPLFVPQGYQDTFGELPAAVKNGLSHRARALAKVIAFLRTRG